MAGKTTVKSKGRRVENEKSKEYQESAASLKAQAQKNREKAETARKKAAATTAAASGAGLSGTGKDAAIAAAAGLIGKAVKGKKIKNTFRLILVVALVVAALFVYFKYFAGNSGSSAPVQSIATGLTHTDIDFQNAILSESRQKKMYVVFEQDVSVETTVTQSLLNLAIFEKSKTINSTGTGYYAVDMEQLSSDSVTVDNAGKTVTVSIPRTILYVVKYDVANSTYSDTTGGLLALGEMKLTLEQTNEIEKSVDAAMHEVLEGADLFAQADELALLNVQSLFQPLVSAVSEEYLVEVAFAD